MRYDGVFVLPAVKTRDRSGQLFATGVAALEALIARRVAPADLSSVITEEALKFLVEYSGGHVRHLMLFMRAATASTDALPIGMPAARKGVQQLVGIYSPSIPDEFWDKLVTLERATDHKINNGDSAYLSLLENAAILEYRDGEGGDDLFDAAEPWYAVHPIVRAIQEVQGAFAEQRRHAVTVADPLIDLFTDPSDIDALARGLDWTKSIGFFFLVIDDLEVRDQAIEAVAQRLHRRHIRRVTIQANDISLLDRLRQLRPRLDADEVVVVTGFENLLRDAEDDKAPVIRSLNVARDSFGRIVLCPILFVVPRFVIRMLAAGAPDFFSTRSGLYVFGEKTQPKRLRHQLLAHDRALDLSFIELSERIEDLEGMLFGLGLPDTPETLQRYFRLAWRLTGLLINRLDLDRATEVATQAYSLARDVQSSQALVFATELGRIAGIRGDAAEVSRYADLVTGLVNEDDGSCHPGSSQPWQVLAQMR